MKLTREKRVKISYYSHRHKRGVIGGFVLLDLINVIFSDPDVRVIRQVHVLQSAEMHHLQNVERERG